MEITNKSVLITGGANGIGLACVKELLRNGAGHVAILDLKNSNGETVANKLNEEFGQGRVIFIVCDVTNSEELEASFAKTVAEFGGLDIVVNNAGIMNDSKWELMININLNAVVHGVLLGFRCMGKDKEGKGGLIINLSSIAGLAGVSTFPIYAATKHAVIGLSRSFGTPFYYEKTGVRVLTLCPGTTITELVLKLPERMMDDGRQEELAAALSNVGSQTVDSVAQGMIQIIKSAPNGSIWVAEGAEPVYQIKLPHYVTLKVQS